MDYRVRMNHSGYSRSYMAPQNGCGCSDSDSSLSYSIEVPSLAMAYVPMQRFTTTFENCRSLQAGTVFPELCKSFFGKRGKQC